MDDVIANEMQEESTAFNESAVEVDRVVVDAPPVVSAITEERFAAILAEKDRETKAQLDRAFGTIGAFKQQLDSLKQSAATGSTVEINADDVAELSAEYPELGDLQLKVLKKVAQKFKGGSSGVSAAQVAKEVESRLHVMQAEMLEADHPDWKEVARDGKFKAWTQTLPQSEQVQLAETWNARLISNKMTQFKEVSRQSASQLNPKQPRQNRFAAAIQPKSSGGASAYNDPNSEEAAYAAAIAA